VNPYRHAPQPEITIVGVEADPFPMKRREIPRARMKQLLLIERAARNLVRHTERAKEARDGFPDSRELNDRCAASVTEAFVKLMTALEVPK
jgi:hypothetical protein